MPTKHKCKFIRLQHNTIHLDVGDGHLQLPSIGTIPVHLRTSPLSAAEVLGARNPHQPQTVLTPRQGCKAYVKMQGVTRNQPDLNPVAIPANQRIILLTTGLWRHKVKRLSRIKLPILMCQIIH